MKLNQVQVKHFRSVNDSGTFDIDSVTCLVGKNEAGKSALLMALAALNPHPATPVAMEKERDYPRSNLTRYKDLHGDEEAVVVRTIWQLGQSEIEAIESEIGKNVLESKLVEVCRRYGNEIEVCAKLDHESALENEIGMVAFSASERSALRSPKTIDELAEALENLEAPKEKHSQLLNRLRQKGDESSRVSKIVIEALPTFMYVSSYDRMEGAIQINSIQRQLEYGELDAESHRGSKLFLEFLDYAGVPIDEITQVSTYETFNALLQAASTTITEQLLEYWTQNPYLDVKVTIDQARPNDPPPLNRGTIARARIINNLHKVDTPFSERSAGFVWFFSFLVKFAQVRNNGHPVILLLDEPGLSLHGRAQGDLLRFIDSELAPSHQVIYSTHSPFMVPPDKLSQVRIVEDKLDSQSTRPRKSLGTTVSQDVLRVGSDTLFPLQGALGYEATQSLFVGKHMLLVEGPSDILYLQALSHELRNRGRSGLDSRWTLCPAGGIDRIMPFVSLFVGKDLHIAVLSDEAAGYKGKISRIRQSDVLQADHFFTVADFVEADEGDVEDLFEAETFAEIINNSFELEGSDRITVEMLENDDSTPRLVKKVGAKFKLLPATIQMFDHYTPAAWLIQHPEFLNAESDALEKTLSLAERIFTKYNSLLPKN